ncbi:MAG: hypothetical protein HPY83_08860 [Anaerolineae bacterium]|nr:hypothetical protein [Anaerolineae bacterium]
MDFLMGLPGYVINVWNCRAAVGRWEGNVLKEALNWEELEEEAIEAIEELGGAVNMSSLYPCPAELAERGVWDEPETA